MVIKQQLEKKPALLLVSCFSLNESYSMTKEISEQISIRIKFRYELLILKKEIDASHATIVFDIIFFACLFGPA